MKEKVRRPVDFAGRLPSLVPWKHRWDRLQDNDNVSGSSDQVGDFDEQGYTSLTGSPKEVGFIRKDETNAEAMHHLGFKWWQKRNLPKNVKKASI